MIISLSDILDEMYEEFPDLKETSIKRICNKGLKGINRVMRDGDELFLKSKDTELKFYIPMSPEAQAERNAQRYYKHKHKKTISDATTNR